MSNPFTKVNAGDKLRIPAATYNMLMDMARDYCLSRQSGGASRPASASGGNTVLVKNDSGTDCARFDVLGIDNVAFDPSDSDALITFQNNLVFSGKIPSSADHTQGKFVICAEPIPQGRLGIAWTGGTCQVQINVTDESHTFADVKEGDTLMLDSVESGPISILWKQAGTGTKWAVVRFGASGGGSSFTWAQVMHEPDDQADYVPIKLNTWSPAWNSNGVEYFPQQTNPLREADRVTYNNREYECVMHHRSTSYITPERPSYWKMVEPIKAYGLGVTGPLSTACPQFSHGMMIPVLMYEDRYYIVGLFTQGGVNAASYGSQAYYITGSFGWIKSTSTNAGRAGSFYR